MSIKKVIEDRVTTIIHDVIVDPVRSGLKRMDDRRFVDPNFAIEDGDGLSGAVKSFIKKTIRKTTRPYVEPIVIRQNLFNDAAYETVLSLKDAFEHEYQDMYEKVVEVSNAERDALNKFAGQIKRVNDLLQNVGMTDKPFGAFDKRTTSQCGEDCIVMYVLHELGYDFSSVHYLDLGANHALALSNTFSLYQRGARGVLVEANPALIGELKLYRSEDVIVNKCVSTSDSDALEFYVLSGDGLSTPSFEEAQRAIELNPNIKIERKILVNAISVNDLLETYFDGAPEVVNLDIEGNEVEILNSMDFSVYRPVVFIIETIPYKPHLVFNEKRDDIISAMHDVGYIEYAFTGINSIFVDEQRLKAQD